MNHSGDAAEQIVRMSLEGTDIVLRLAGTGAKNIAVLIYSILKGENQTKGKARLTNLIRSGKELKVFTVKQCDLKKFQEEATKYGVLYTVLKDRGDKNPNTIVDVIARAEDASKINRIVERFKLASVDIASIETSSSYKEPVDISVPSIDNSDDILDDILSVQKEDNSQDIGTNTQDFFGQTTEKSPPSEPFSKTQKKADEVILNGYEKPSVREKLNEIKNSRAEKPTITQPEKTDKPKTNKPINHKQPKKKKTPKARDL